MFMRLLRAFILLWLAGSCTSAQVDFLGGASPFARKRPVRARLVLSHETAKPGETVMAAVELTMDAGWHTYWRNAGDSGEATKILWGAMDGLSPGEIQWPVPEKFTA